LLPENATSRYYDALNFGIGYRGPIYSIQIRYERVAPEYQTLGAYYFTNDIRNITLVPSVKALKGLLSINGNIGIQKNNLDESRTTTTARLVTAVNAAYTPTPQWSTTLAYSNFSSYTNIRQRTDPFATQLLDTLNFYQVSQTLNGGVVHSLGSTQAPQSIMMNVSYQRASNNANAEIDSQSDFITGNIAYTYTVARRTTLATSLNGYHSAAVGTKTLYFGPAVSVNHNTESGIRTSLSAGYNTAKGKQSPPSVINSRLNCAYTPKKEKGGAQKHTFSLGLNFLQRLKAAATRSHSELTILGNYAYSF